jgi:hypothetical protein
MGRENLIDKQLLLLLLVVVLVVAVLVVWRATLVSCGCL